MGADRAIADDAAAPDMRGGGMLRAQTPIGDPDDDDWEDDDDFDDESDEDDDDDEEPMQLRQKK